MLAEQRFASSVMINGAAPEAAPGVGVMPAAIEAPPGAPPTPTEPHLRRRQSQKQLAQLEEVAQMLNGLAAADASFQQAMAGAGLIEAYQTECHARYAAAEAAVEARHRAMIEALTATEMLAAANLQARAAYSAFRQVARTLVTSSAGQAALKLDEAPPANRATFVRMATAALTTAQGAALCGAVAGGDLWARAHCGDAGDGGGADQRGDGAGGGAAPRAAGHTDTRCSIARAGDGDAADQGGGAHAAAAQSAVGAAGWVCALK